MPSAIIDIFNRCPDFRQMPASALQSLAEAATLRTLACQQAVWSQGDAASHVYVPERGLLQIAFLGHEGNLFTSSLIRFGHLFGEAEVFAGLSRRFNEARAISPLTLAVIPAAHFRECVAASPVMSAYWLQASNIRFILSLKHAYAISLRSAEERLLHIIALLLDYAADARGERVELPFSHEALANLAALSRPVTTQVISQWHQRGWVEPSYQTLTVCNKAAFSGGQITPLKL